jgi:hypothetical protein
MNKMLRNCVAIAATLAMALVLVDARAAGPGAAPQARQVDKLELHIAADGTGIVDQDGREVARFADRVRMKSPLQRTKLQGCMCCEPECIVYEQERCIKYINSCTWSFDCNCPR